MPLLKAYRLAPPDRFASLRAQEGKPLTLAGCWAHLRRGFFVALEQSRRQPGWILRQIGHLYSIERKLRDQRAGAQSRQAYRASRSQMVYARIHRALKRWQNGDRILHMVALLALGWGIGALRMASPLPINRADTSLQVS
jgi:hypothetical protein